MKLIYALFMSWLYSYVVYLMFEAPSICWMKGLFKRDASKEEEKLIKNDQIIPPKLIVGESDIPAIRQIFGDNIEEFNIKFKV